jgi:hypothetical protein
MGSPGWNPGWKGQCKSLSDPEGVAQSEGEVMSTYTQLTYHIVFGTKGREMVLDE